IATATADDSEMAERIRRHRELRPPSWATTEEPLQLLAAVQAAPDGSFVIVDCLTLWVSNLLGAGHSNDEIRARAEKAALELSRRGGSVVPKGVGWAMCPAKGPARPSRDVRGAGTGCLRNPGE